MILVKSITEDIAKQIIESKDTDENEGVICVEICDMPYGLRKELTSKFNVELIRDNPWWLSDYIITVSKSDNGELISNLKREEKDCQSYKYVVTDVESINKILQNFPNHDNYTNVSEFAEDVQEANDELKMSILLNEFAKDCDVKILRLSNKIKYLP